ncbi:MAG TPA: tetratricopeptide repeat protein [Iamia sp.]|nr:tetratricopeptide repeat protein [Iamia sp.]
MAVTARFTPSVLDAELLEDLFVAREHLVADAVGRIERAARSDERSARLFVGPRGAGKTHLLSLVAHRARALPGFGSTFQLAWLPEDMWTVDGYDDLVSEILDAVEPGLEASDGTPTDRLRAAATAGGPVVVLVENLDRVFGDIGEDGQRRLRALIENDRSLLLIATTTRLDDELRAPGFPFPDDDDQPAYFREADWPFYGFFDTHELTPFTLDQATEMLAKIATASGDVKLARTLQGPTIRRRLAAIDRLASGQPRMWALLAAGLSIEGLDELVEALMTRFDDLTPYFQSQMQTLSPQERKVVRALADAPGSLNVGQIAERSGIADKSVARTITGLRKKGWLRLRTGPIVAKADGRLSYYDLAEPLARLAFQLKESRGQPVRTVVEFLKHWFDAESLEPLGTNSLVDAYLALARKEALTEPSFGLVRSLLADRASEETDPTEAVLSPRFRAAQEEVAAVLRALDDGLEAWQDGDPEHLLSEPASVTSLVEDELGRDPDGHRTRLKLARLALDFADPSGWIDRTERTLSSTDGATHAEAARVAAVWRARDGDAEAARSLLAAATKDGGLAELLWLAGKLVQAGAPDASLAVLADVAFDEVPDAVSINVAHIRELALHRLGRSAEVIGVWSDLCEAMAVGHAPFEDQIGAAINLGAAYGDADDPHQAALIFRSTSRLAASTLGEEHPTTRLCQESSAVAACHSADFATAIPQLVRIVDRLERERGPSDPHTLLFMANLGSAYAQSGDFIAAHKIEMRAHGLSAQVLADDHPTRLQILTGLGLTRVELGRPDLALDSLRQALEGYERSLGAYHPLTRMALENVQLASRALGTG